MTIEVDLAPIKDGGAKNARSKMLDQKRREKLLKIQKREKLKDLLVKKFIQKYPMVNGADVAAQVAAMISSEVISEEDLNKLEQNIRKVAIAGGAKLAATTPGPASSSTKEERQAESLHTSKSDPNIIAINDNPAGKKKNVEDMDVMVYDQFGTPREYTTTVYKVACWNDDWANISKMKKKEHSVFEDKRKKKLIDIRENWKKDLDKHVKMKVAVKSDELVKKANYKVEIEAKTKEWEKEERAKQEAIREANLQVKRERAQQLKELRDARAKHEAMEKKHEAEMAKRIADAALEDKRKEEQKLINQKIRLKEFLLQNEVGKKIQEERKQKLMDEDAKLLLEAENRAIKRERQRAWEEEERQRKMRERVKVVEHSDSMVKAREMERKDMERMIRIQAEHALAEKQKEEAKAKKRKDDNLSNTEYLKQQIAWREAAKAQLEIDNAKFAVLYKEEATKAIAEENEKAQKRRLRALDNRREIVKQVESKIEKKLHPVLLSDIEKQLNSDMLHKLQAGEIEVPEKGNLKPW